MIEAIKKLFRTPETPKPVYPKPVELQTEYVFSIGGVDYFKCCDFLNMPVQRAEKASVFYEELKANIDFEYLDWYTEEIDKCLNRGDLTAVARLNGLLRERLTMAPDPQLLFKLATVMFFDANENIYDYDFRYNEKKKKAFIDEGLDVFFCKMPIKTLIPHLDISKIDSTQLKEAMLATSAKTVQLLDNLLAGESMKSSTEEQLSSLTSARQQALAFLTSEGLDYTNIISSLNALGRKNNGSPEHTDKVRG